MIQFGANFSTLGIPETGLSPTITIRDTSDGLVVVDAAIMTEIGGGAYKYDFVNDVSKEYSASIDGGSDSLDSRYFSAWSERAKSEAEIVLIKNQTDKMNFNGDNIQARVADKGVLNNPPSQDIDDYKADVSNLEGMANAIREKTDNLPSGIPKNVALNNFKFLMVISSDHITPATGKTVTGEISQDGGAFNSLTNDVYEISSGVYKVNLTQSEMNAGMITLKFIADGCDQRTITLKTSS